ncbi:MAG TPA: hypothetical protein VMD59_18780 [Acidimicrobiales bacterium]|nr:hypothetical protein [Acidimicrobiales bacterium]
MQRVGSRVWRIVALVAVANVAVAAPAIAQGARRPDAACPACGRNLILNSGADQGPGTNDDTVVKVPHWKGTGAFTAAQYAWGGGDISNTTPGPKNHGKNYFYGGPDAAKSTGTQLIAVAAGGVSSGKAHFTLSGWLGGYSSQSDDCALYATFENSAGAPLDIVHVGPVTAAQRKDNSELLLRSTTGLVPAKTATVKVQLVMIRYDGSDNDGMADSLSLVFTNS